MLIFILSQVLAQTSWTNPETGLTYDWTILQQPADQYYKVIDNTNMFAPSTYNFNFDVEIADACTGQPATATETVEFSDGWQASCSIMGRKGNQEVKAIENGVRIIFSGGDVCYNFDVVDCRKMYADLICSNVEGDWRVVQSTYTDYCNVGVAKDSPAGCGFESSRSWVWVMVLALFLGGALWYARNHSKLEWLSEMPGKEMLDRVVQKIKDMAGGLVDKVKSVGGSKNYEMV